MIPKTDLGRGDVFTMGDIDSFGWCVADQSAGWYISAFFVDQQRCLDTEYIDFHNICYAVEHGPWGFVEDGWKVVGKREVPGGVWPPIVQYHGPTIAIIGRTGMTQEIEDFSDFKLVMQTGSAHQEYIAAKLAQIVISGDPNSVLRYRPPTFVRPVPDRFEAYCNETRERWQEVLRRIHEQN